MKKVLISLLLAGSFVALSTVGARASSIEATQAKITANGRIVLRANLMDSSGLRFDVRRQT